MLLVCKIFVIKFVVDLTIFFVWKKGSINYALQIDKLLIFYYKTSFRRLLQDFGSIMRKTTKLLISL